MTRLQYAVAGVAHVLAGIEESAFERVRAVYIFGSVANGSATADSDVDVFFDVDLTVKAQQKFRRTVERLFDGFRLSKTGLKFQIKGIANEFSPVVGKLAQWPDLKRSIAIRGIQVYGPAVLKAEGQPWMIYSWEKLKNRGAFLNAVYGYTIQKKHYAGFLKRSNGFKIGKSAIAIPRSESKEFEALLKKYDASYTVQDFFR